MKKLSLAFIALLFLVSQSISAGIVWNPAANFPSDGLWATAANWTAGVPTSADQVVFNVNNADDCIVNSVAELNQLVQGDGGDGATIIIKDGGSVTTGNTWSAIGYNRAATLEVETGGSFTFGEHAWIGLTAGGIGTININGGTITVTGMTGLGWDGGLGFVTVNDGGTFNCSQFGTSSIKEGSLLNICGGTVVLTGDKTGDVTTLISQGRIVAYSGGSVPVVNIIGGNTVITSTPDITAPTVDATTPIQNATDIAVVTNVQFTFSEVMNEASVEAAISFSPAIANKIFTWNGNIVIVTGDAMQAETSYTATIATTAKDINDNTLTTAYNLSFTTATADAPPVVANTTPIDGATSVEPTNDIVLVFSKTMNKSTVESAISFTPTVTGALYTWSNDDKTVTIATDHLYWDTDYAVTISTDAEAVEGTVKALQEAVEINFTTKASELIHTRWTGAGADNNWNTPENWDNGVPNSEILNARYKMQMGQASAIPTAVLNSSVSITSLAMGDGGDGYGSELIIADGGSLTVTTSDWATVAYGKYGSLTVETGGSLTTLSRLDLGTTTGGSAKLSITGGTVNIAKELSLNLANSISNQDTLIITAGELNAQILNIKNNSFAKLIGGTINAESIQIIENGYLEITNGVLYLDGDQKAAIDAYITNSQIIGAGGIIVTATVADGKTKVECPFATQLSTKQETNITCYPNPVRDMLFIQNDLEDASISIYSIAGAIIYQSKSNSVGLQSINVSDFAAGTYIISLTSEDMHSVEKVIVR